MELAPARLPVAMERALEPPRTSFTAERVEMYARRRAISASRVSVSAGPAIPVQVGMSVALDSART